MSLLESLRSLKIEDLLLQCESKSKQDVIRTVQKESLSFDDFLALISETAIEVLEPIASRANEISKRQFGKTIGLYTPLYLGNYCENQCIYCGFNSASHTKRHKLSSDEIHNELESIHKMGLRDILLLTGESSKHTSVEYIKNAVLLASQKFKSIGIEIYPLESDGYKTLIDAGVNSLTIYQETYDEIKYDELHIKGPKKNFEYRLNAPERAALAGMPQIGIGVLFGLSNPKVDAIKLFWHLKYLEKKYPHVELSISLPRLRAFGGDITFGTTSIPDRQFVQLLLAFRLCFPRLGINLSTREAKTLRENMIPLGITKMSAGVKTSVGGHSVDGASEVQFEIDDDRSVLEIVEMLKGKGYQAIYSDWVRM